MDKVNKPSEKKKNLKLLERYDNDDLSSYAGADYSDKPFEIGSEPDVELRHERNWQYPGVSGKSDDENSWVKKKEYKKQKDFTGFGPKDYHRSDDRIYEEVCEMLMKHREVDASHIGVKVEKGIVILSGKVDSRLAKKTAEYLVEKIPGVQDVRNELMVIKGDTPSGPDASVKKDLGIQ